MLLRDDWTLAGFGRESCLFLMGPLANNTDCSPDEDMKIEKERSKSKKSPHMRHHHPHIRGRYVEFDVDVDVMSPQEPTPSEGSGGKSEGQAELEEFQDATESPSTVGGHPNDGQEGGRSGEPGDRPREKLTVETDRPETENGEHHQGEEHEGPGRGNEPVPMNGDRVGVEAEVENNLNNGDTLGAEVKPQNNLAMDEHAEERSMDGSPDSDHEDGDDGQWNAVCVACLRVYSRDPDLTITLETPEDKQGASNLVRGKEPAGATM